MRLTERYPGASTDERDRPDHTTASHADLREILRALG
jgi:hypothetical protein